MCHGRNVPPALRRFSLLLWCFSLLLVLPSFAPASIVRKAFLRHGSVSTSRLLLEQPRRSLAQSIHGEAAYQVWAMGFPEQQQAAVRRTLCAWGGQVLHPLPDRESHHWLVLATEHAMRQLLTQHAEATAALLPEDLKLAPAVLAHCKRRKSESGDQAQHVALVALLPLATASDVEQLAQQAQAQLFGAVGPSCTVQASPGRQYLRVKVCPEGVDRATRWLAAVPGSTWVDVESPVVLKNLVAGAISQASSELSKQLKGKVPAAPPPAGLLRGLASPFFPHWKAGLTGKGEVVGVLDTGADLDSCFLWDPTFTDYQNCSSTQYMRVPTYGYKADVDRSLRKFFVPRQAGARVFQNHTHRKVVQYVMWSDDVDGQNPQYTDGHGTHVSTTIAGSPYGFNALKDPTIATGAAPDAKLAIFDAGSSSADGNVYVDRYIQENPSLAYEFQRQAGARITSTSVGPTDNTYLSPTCYLLDDYAWHKPDTLHVVAAGNAGDQQDQRHMGTVQAPATCKNVLGVGAAESWVDTGPQAGLPFDLLGKDDKLVRYSLSNYQFPHVTSNKKPGRLQFTSADGSRVVSLDGGKGDYVDMEWSSCCSGPTSELDALAGVKLKLVLPEPRSGCNLTKHFSASEPVMVLLRKTAADNADINEYADPDYSSLYGYADYDHNSQTCNAAASIASLVKNKAAAALFYWANKADTATFVSVRINTRLPAAVIQKADVGDQLEALLLKGKIVYVEWIPAPRPVDLPPYENIAWFSSYGSTAADHLTSDARIKPELVAPGYLVSAHSDGKFSGKMDQCAVTAKAGTSYAAPVVAGAAALARQYFTYGYYPAGNPCSKSKHAPSAPLLKAVLVAGTAAMTGVSVINNQPLAPPPSPYQGFGRLDLSASLPLKKETPHWRMQVVDGAVFKSDGVEHNYTLSVVPHPDGPQPPLVATLVWHDYPAFPGARQVLVNNLDLLVEGPLGQASTLHWGNGKQGGDFLNNVEKVIIPKAGPGTYRFIIRAKYLFIGATPQPYSLVVLGNTQGTLDSPYNPAIKAAKHSKTGQP